MAAFLAWFNGEPTIDPVLKSGVAHLWIVTIHPFDDGNGRIARAVADMQLARSAQSPQRFYSMSSHIRQERKAYYDRLEAAPKERKSDVQGKRASESVELGGRRLHTKQTNKRHL